MEHDSSTRPLPLAIAWYREFVPCKALQDDVYAFFSFVPGRASVPRRRLVLREVAFSDATFCSPQFADGHVSMVFELGQRYGADGRWCTDSLGGTVVGPMSRVGRTTGTELPEMVGIFFRPARVAPLFRVPLSCLINQTVAIDDLWGPTGSRLASELGELNETERIDTLESAILERLAVGRRRTGSVDLEGVTASVLRRRGQMTVGAMACAAGVSRQHLSRLFREHLGIGPKLYCRLARFQSGLRYAGRRAPVDWARSATNMGYADQSHMIAEFRKFSGLTPQALANREWFHPFIERATSNR